MYCRNCKLIYGNKRAADNWGNPKGHILVLRDTPTSAECSSGNIKYSKANKILISSLETYGFKNNYFVTNILNCYPKINYTINEINACLPKFVDVFSLYDFKFVITAGLLPYQTLLNRFDITNIHRIAGTITQLDNIPVLHTYSYKHLAKDVKLYNSYVKTLSDLVDMYKIKIDINHKTLL